ncbi:MAG TPA: hypothetical protein VIA11_20325 [Acidimicrobiia bacterium]|jgi:uncharacterized protein (TIGR02246 family)|nr:hypothetical protein [Acidimicrobiia bacterium]
MTDVEARKSHTPRPTLGLDGAEAHEAEHAIDLLVRDLQTGWDTHDPDVTDRRLGGDVLWGSPFGATVCGYSRLHEIHVRLKRTGVGGRSSRFEVVQYLTPARGIVIVHVRRTALDEGDTPVAPTEGAAPPFSEMALYVLVQRDGDWWVAAGQNTPISPAAP